MSDAAVLTTSTWAIRTPTRNRSTNDVQANSDRSVVAAGGMWLTTDALRALKAFRLPSMVKVSAASPALGATTPRDVRAEALREQDFAAAFNTAAELADEMVAADEMDHPDPDIWNCAWTRLSPFAATLAAPLVSPLQLGGVSCEWHEHGMNIELRFRGIDDVYAVVEDVRGEAVEFHGRDPGLIRATSALRILVARQV